MSVQRAGSGVVNSESRELETGQQKVQLDYEDELQYFVHLGILFIYGPHCALYT